MSDASDVVFPGTARFQPLSRLGTGGMGVVYEVLDRERQIRVALKAPLRWGGEDISRLKNEFRARQDLDHPNLVRLGELFEQEGRWFFTMELVEGVDLLSYVRPQEAATRPADPAAATPPPGQKPSREALKRGLEAQRRTLQPIAFDEQRLRAAFSQLTQGLLALHRASKVHRDIKPSNVLVTGDGRTVLLDFGLSAHLGEQADPDEEEPGTALYMAPEKERGPAADWYSLGVVLFQALTGRLPFTGEGDELLAAKRAQEAPRPSALVPSVPQDLDELCHALLRRAPSERPDGAQILRVLRPDAPPEVRSQPAPPTFVGRKGELAQLRAALARARQGTPCAVFIEGESGMGKSALLQEFTQGLAVSGEPVTVLAGRCYERESVPYKGLDGVMETLSLWLRRWPDSELAALLSSINLGVLVQVFPTLEWLLARQKVRAVEREPLQPHAERGLVLGALHELFRALAGRQPLVLAIDDLQWASQDSLEPLSQMIRPPSQAAILLVATVQTPAAPGPDAPSPAPPEHVAFGRKGFQGDVQTITLGRLPPQDATALARAHLGNVQDSGPRPEAVAAETGGHPLFIEELSKHLSQHPGVLPERLGLDETLGAKISVLEPMLRRLLDLVALAGIPIGQDVLAWAIGEGDVSMQLAALRAARLVRTAGDTAEPYHNRIRQVVLQRLSPKERRAGHKKLATALEALRGPAPSLGELTSLEARELREVELAFELAYHLDAADEPKRAFPYALLAAEAARKRFAIKLAERFARIAVRGSVHASPQERQRLLEGLGKVFLFQGRHEEANACLREALGLPDSAVDKARLHRWLGEVAFQQEKWAAAIEQWERGLRLLGLRLPHLSTRLSIAVEDVRRHLGERPPGTASRREELLAVQLLSRLSGAQLYYGNNRLAFWAHLRSLHLAERHPRTPELAVAYANHGMFTALRAPYAEAWPFAERALAINLELGDTLGACNAHLMAGTTAYLCAVLEEARVQLERAISEFERLGCSIWETEMARMMLSFVVYRLGFLGRASALSRQLYAQTEARGHRFLADNVLIGWLLSSGGNVPAEHVTRALKRATSPLHRLWALQARVIQQLLAERDLEGALATLEECRQPMEITGDMPDILNLHVTALRLKALPLAGGRREAPLAQALKLNARALRAARRYFQVAVPSILRERALLTFARGRRFRALYWSYQSLSVALRHGARFEQAQSLFVRGRLHTAASVPGGEADLASARRELQALGGEFALDFLEPGGA